MGVKSVTKSKVAESLPDGGGGDVVANQNAVGSETGTRSSDTGHSVTLTGRTRSAMPAMSAVVKTTSRSCVVL